MTFQEQFLVSRSSMEDLLSGFGLKLMKYTVEEGNIRPFECTYGEFGTSTGSVFTWFACVTEGPVHETKPAVLMIGDWYRTKEVLSEEEFLNYLHNHTNVM